MGIITGEGLRPYEKQKIIIQGMPKDAGKSTFAYSAAATHGPLLGLQYDLGSPTIPPRVDKTQVYVKTYPVALPGIPQVFDRATNKSTGEYNLSKTDRWTPDKSVGEEMLRDILAVRDAFIQGRPVLLSDGAGGKIEVPLPGTLVLDGCVGLVQGITDWIFAVNDKIEVEDFIGAKGNVNKFLPYQKRLRKLTDIFNMVIPLPCNVVLITWSAPEIKDEKPTGKYFPDIGGKLDIQGAGKFDSSLRAYSKQESTGTHYYISYRGGEIYPGLGIRGRYDAGKDIDVTITDKGPLPYDLVFPPQ